MSSTVRATGLHPFRLLGLVVVAAVALIAIIWWLSGSGGTLFGGKAGFSSVSGSWHFDEAGFRADFDTTAEAYAQRPIEAANEAQMRKQLDGLAAPYLAINYHFMAKSYIVRQGGNESETACSYVGVSSNLLQVVGAADGEGDDLTFIIDPGSSRIYVRTSEAAFPFVRE